MLKRSWLQALCAAVCVLALTGCGDECVDQYDCRNKKGSPPQGKMYQCIEGTCELKDAPDPEIKCSPECATGEFCDTSSGQGVCLTCSATQGCTAPLFCDTSADSGKGLCRACSDTAQGNGTDQGCSTAAPVCDAAGGNGAGACKACMNSATGNGTDLGCAATSPVCDTTAGNGAGVCKACMDSATGTGTDLGCADTAPICNTTAGGGAGQCKSCVDSATGNGTDLGCSATTPLCSPAANNGAGLCRTCVDSVQGAGTDQGCSATTPYCDATAGNGAGVCRICSDSAQGAGTDLGCSATAPLCEPAAGTAGACRVCQNSATGGGTDVGCSATSPICDATAASGAGVCKVCMNTVATGPSNVDDGCNAAAAICDAPANNGAGACVTCLSSNNEGCPGSQTCNAEGTGCQGCADDTECSTSTPGTPICRQPPPVSQCVQCTTDAHCAATQPVCETATYTCGCTSDAECAVAPGNTDFCDPAASNGQGLCKVCITDQNCRDVDPTRPVCVIENGQPMCACRTNADCALTQQCNASKACEAVPGVDPAATSAQIQSFIDAPVGTIAAPITIQNAYVTYLKPLLGTGADAAGFFLQAQPDGPAMFVAVDPATLQDPVKVGDRVTLTVGEVVKLSGDLEAAGTISNVIVVHQGAPVQNLNTATPPGLAVDRSSASDLQTNLVTQYESELISLTGTLASVASSSGTLHVAFDITTTGMPTATNTFKLRVPAALADALDMVQTCDFTLKAGPMWRFTSGTTTPVTTAQPSAYYTSDLVLSNCPAPKPLTAVTASPTQVLLNLDRRIDPATVLATGAQFTFDNGLTATGAQVSGRQITLTTSTQTPGTLYTVTVAASVKDLLGSSVTAPANTATFKGYRAPAVLLISEVNPNVSSTNGNRDLIELRVLTAGTTDGMTLTQEPANTSTLSLLATLPDASVQAGDIIVIHMSPDAARGDATTSETVTKNENTASTNYATAWDFVGNATHIVFSNQVLRIKTPTGVTQDAVPFVVTSGTPPAAFPTFLQAIQAEGLWSPANCGGAPCTYSSNPTAQAVSAVWAGAGTSVTGNSVRRISATDTNTSADWAVGANSWGLPNP